MAQTQAASKSPTPLRIGHPSNLNWLVEAVGLEGAITIVENYGGRQVYIPNGTSRQEGSIRRFEDRLGCDLAHSMMRYFGGSTISAPISSGWLTEVYYVRGLSMNDIAEKLHCSVSTVWRRLNRSTKAKLRAVTFCVRESPRRGAGAKSS